MEPFALGMVVLFGGIALVPLLARRVRIPVVVAEVVFGILVGRSLLNLVPEHPALDFFASFGLVYLMVLAGLEGNFLQVQGQRARAVAMAGVSLGVPLLAGMALGPVLGVPPLLMGVMLSTTSLGLVLPLTREVGIGADLRQLLLASVVLVDVLSIFLLAVALGIERGDLGVEFLYSFLAVLVLFLLPWAVGRWRVRERLGAWLRGQGHFELEVRLAFALVLALGALSETLGFHAIIGGFIAGLVLAEVTPRASLLERKLEGFGYGFFVPLFFILMGAQVDLPAVLATSEGAMQVALLIGVGLASKAVGVTGMGLLLGMGWRTSLGLGMVHGARMSLVLAGAQIALTEGVIGPPTFSALVLLAVVSALLNPTLGRALLTGRPEPRVRPHTSRLTEPL